MKVLRSTFHCSSRYISFQTKLDFIKEYHQCCNFDGKKRTFDEKINMLAKQKGFDFKQMIIYLFDHTDYIFTCQTPKNDFSPVIVFFDLNFNSQSNIYKYFNLFEINGYPNFEEVL